MKRMPILVGLVALAVPMVAWAGDTATGKTPPSGSSAAPPPFTAPAAKSPTPPPQHRAYTPATLIWMDAPPALPKGSKVALMQGDPSAPGLFTMRIKLPAGYRVPPHFHPADEQMTVISGEVMMALGDTFDESKGHALPAGSFSIMPKGVHHYAWSKIDSEIQVHGIGPWGIIYVNPQDDPRNIKEAAK